MKKRIKVVRRAVDVYIQHNSLKLQCRNNQSEVIDNENLLLLCPCLWFGEIKLFCTGPTRRLSRAKLTALAGTNSASWIVHFFGRGSGAILAGERPGLRGFSWAAASSSSENTKPTKAVARYRTTCKHCLLRCCCSCISTVRQSSYLALFVRSQTNIRRK